MDAVAAVLYIDASFLEAVKNSYIFLKFSSRGRVQLFLLKVREKVQVAIVKCEFTAFLKRL